MFIFMRGELFHDFDSLKSAMDLNSNYQITYNMSGISDYLFTYN